MTIEIEDKKAEVEDLELEHPSLEILEHIASIRSHKEEYCQKQLQLCDLAERELKEYTYSEEEPLKVIAFLETLTQWEGEFAGQPFVLTPWQRFLMFLIYGYYNKDGTYLHTSVLLEIGKKNGKTFLGSGLLLYNLLKLKGSQIYTVATDYKQSELAFNNVAQFIRHHPKLKNLEAEDKIRIDDRSKTILYRPNFSKIRCLSEDRTRNLQGLLPAFALFDEIASYKKYELIGKLDSARPKNGISLYITTAETNENNPGFVKYNLGAKVLDPKSKVKLDNFLPVIYELDEEDVWTDTTKYKKANPNLDIAVTSTKTMTEEMEAALLTNDATLMAQFQAWRLNRWSKNTQEGIKDCEWEASIKNTLAFADYLTEEKLKTYPCMAAVDLSKANDYTAYSKVFYIPEINKFYFKHKFYIPKETIETKAKTENANITSWIRDKYITPTIGGGPNNTIINYDYLKKDIVEDFQTYKISALAFDPSCGGTKLMMDLEMEHPEIQTYKFGRQWNHICPANRQYLDNIRYGNVIDDNPVMEWMVTCVRIVYGPNNNIYFEKASYKNAPERIDGVDTSVMALASLIENGDLKPIDDKAKKDALMGFFKMTI